MAVRRLLFALVLLGGCVRPNPPPKPIESDKFCAIFLGYGGRAFSGGLDTYATDLRSNGWDARVYEATQADKAFRETTAVARRKIAAIGHSFGGAAAVEFAERCGERNLQLDTVALLDGSQPSRPGGDFTTAVPIQHPIHGNVRKAVIYCIADTPILKQWPCPRAMWSATTIGDTPAVPRGVDHLNIDENADVRNTVLRAIK